MKSKKSCEIRNFFLLNIWRGGRDSNPRSSLTPDNHLAGGPIQPLWHLPEINRTAEGEGFEPTVGCPTPVFKTGTLNHSVIPPNVQRF